MIILWYEWIMIVKLDDISPGKKCVSRSLILPFFQQQKIRGDSFWPRGQLGWSDKCDIWFTFSPLFPLIIIWCWRTERRFTLTWETLIQALRISIINRCHHHHQHHHDCHQHTIIIVIGIGIINILKIMINQGVCTNKPWGEGRVPCSTFLCCSGSGNLQGRHHVRFFWMDRWEGNVLMVKLPTPCFAPTACH